MVASSETSFPEPDAEEERLADLHAYDVLDTAPEQTYDDLTRLAAKVCERPMAAITFIDEHRQWVKAEVGGGAQTSPRSESFCAHAIVDPEEVYVVEDASQHPVFEDNPYVQQAPELRFYAGAPVRSFRGHGLGTICVLDTDPGRLADEERDALRSLSRTVTLQLELRRHARALGRAKEDMELFASAVGGDAREQLDVIQAALHRLDAQVDGLDEEAKAELWEGKAAARHLGRTISGLQDYVRIAGRRNPMGAVTLSEALEDAKAQLAVHDGEPAPVEGHGLPVVLADRHQVTVLLHRLLLLVTDLAPRPSRIDVTAHRGDGRWRIGLSASAEAVDTERWRSLQSTLETPDRETQADEAAWTLHLCRRIVDRHGGELGLEDASEDQLDLWFTLPGRDEA